ncbi:MAG: uL15m family ribosomal protein [Candidatus Dojkabacteria bacterium]
MLNNLPSPKTIQAKKKIGRGIGSGVGGHTSGRGGKGQTARGGHKQPRPGFEGGQNPINRRLPIYKGTPSKGKGFTGRGTFMSMQRNSPVKLSLLADAVKESKNPEVSIVNLVEYGLISPKFHKELVVKVLFDKEIDIKINLKGVATSKTAKSAIEKAGGTVE